MPYGNPGSIPGSPYGGLTMDYIDGLTKQVFILDYLRNGLFPCNSTLAKTIRTKKRAWAFNDRFEYRMLLANTNTGGTLNSSLFNPGGGQIRPGDIEYGLFRATYGSLMDGLRIDMTANLETAEKAGRFNTDYATKFQGLRFNLASLWKNFCIHGSYGVLFQVCEKNTGYVVTNATSGATTPLDATALRAGFTPLVPPAGTPINAQSLYPYRFQMNVENTVFASNFKTGRVLIYIQDTTNSLNTAPWSGGKADFGLYVLDNQPGTPGVLTLAVLPGSSPTVIKTGGYIEVSDNRHIEGFTGSAFTSAGINPAVSGMTYQATQSMARTGAFEGLADIFPWYTTPFVYSGGTYTGGARLGLDLPFREQPNRLRYTVEQSGFFYTQKPGETIMDAVLSAIMACSQAVDPTNLGVTFNPITRAAIEFEEGQTMGIRATRQLATSSPVMFQRGVTATSYHIGSKTIPESFDDMNLPTDIIIVGPREMGISYNTWDNSLMEIEKMLQDSWGDTNKPERVEEVQIPGEMLTGIDFSKRIVYGTPSLTDGVDTGRFIHPRNTIPMHLYEMGALFCEVPHAYTIVKLNHKYFTINDTEPDFSA